MKSEWVSVLIYIGTFALSYLIGIFAEAKEGRQRIIWVLLSFMPLVVLAGLRSPEVGVDTDYYPLPYYCYSLEMSLPDMMMRAGCEPGFSALIWIAARLTRSFNATLLIVQFLMVAPLVWAIKRFEVKRISVAVLVYSCVFFPWSLNIMRQSLAASFFLPAMYFAITRNPTWFLLSVFVGSSFHLTGFLGLPFWIIASDKFIKRDQLRRNIVITMTIGAVAIALFLIFHNDIFNILIKIKPSYSIQFKEIGTGSFNTFLTLYPASIALIGGYICMKEGGLKNNNRAKILFNLILGLSAEMAILSTVSPSLSRVGQMLLIFCPYCVAGMGDMPDKKGLEKILVIFSAVLFLWVYCYGDSAGIIPYSIQLIDGWHS